MADTPPTVDDDTAILNETPNQKAARIRRERREAKIKAGGTDRLNKIMNVSGRTGPPPEDPKPPSAQVSRTSTPQPMPGTSGQMPNPVTASQNFNAPGAAEEDPQAALLRQMMQQMITGGNAPVDDPAMNVPPSVTQQFPPGVQGNANEDPMLKMMQQLMGGQMPQGMAQEVQQPPPSSAWAWRTVHAVFAASLAFYIGMQSSFDGTKSSRESPDTYDSNGLFQRPFYLFATTELILQSTRFFLERGQIQGSGILGMLTQFLPEPYAGYLRVAGRYSVIYTTLVSDAMTIVFVLGLLAWWSGRAT